MSRPPLPLLLWASAPFGWPLLWAAAQAVLSAGRRLPRLLCRIGWHDELEREETLPCGCWHLYEVCARCGRAWVVDAEMWRCRSYRAASGRTEEEL